MRRFIPLLLFVALCVVSGWIGSRFAQGQAPNDYQCRSWACQGTVEGCTFTSGNGIYGCFFHSGAYCSNSIWYGACDGIDGMGDTCVIYFADCNNPVFP